MFGPESIPGWNVEEDTGDSATGLASLGGDVMVPEPPDPLVEPEPPVESDPVEEPLLKLELLVEPDPLVEPEPPEELEPLEGLEPESLEDEELVLVEEEPGAGEVALWWRRAVAVLPTSAR
jgi:hypothetical protein